MTRRFYKTASAISRPDILKTYDEAVKHATSCIEQGMEDSYYIVEVVAVVRHKETPVIVEKVRR